jgi:hypothetical protein
MSNTKTFWQPAGNLSDAQAQALCVMARAKPDQSIYQSLLARKLQQLIDQSPKEALSALEMSQEQAPELYLLAQNQPQTQWAQALMNSDSMHSLMARVDWNLPGQQVAEPPETSLQSLLEQLP